MKSDQSLKSTQPKTVKLDIAYPDNYDEIMDLVLHIPNTEQKYLYNVDLPSVAKNVAMFMAENDCFILRNDDDAIVGVILLDNLRFNWWNENEVVLSNPILYVLPEYRSFKALNTLLEAAEEYAKIKDIPFVCGLVYVTDLDVKRKLLKRKNYKEVGSLLMHMPD